MTLSGWARALEGWTREVVFVSAAYVVAIYLWLGRYALPQADDFDFGVFYQRFGFWGSQAKWYYGWNGKYTFNAVTTAFVACIDISRHYWIVPFAIITTVFAAIYWVLRAMDARGSRLAVGRTAMLLTAIVMLGSPSKNDAYYFLVGATVYPIANACLAVLCVPLVRLFTDRQPRLWRHFALVGFLAAFIIGCNETSMLIVDATIGGAFLAALVWRRSALLQLGLLLALCGALSWVVAHAPGNDVRASFMPHTPDFDLAQKAATDQTRKLLAAWTKEPLLFAGSALLWSHAARFFRRVKRPLFWLAVVPPLTVATVWLSIFPSWYAKGMAALPRTLNVSYAVFLAGWFLGTGALARVIRDHAAAVPTLGRAARFAASWAVVAALLLHPALESALKDVRHDCVPYYEELGERFHQLRAAAQGGERDVMVHPLQHQPANLFVMDLGEVCTQNWPNTTYAEFFGLKSVRYFGAPLQECPTITPKARTVVNPYSVQLFRQ
jgi:thiosulfate reductase cytochrome b subunit